MRFSIAAAYGVFFASLAITFAADGPKPEPAAAPDAVDREIARLKQQGFPVLNLHAHLKGGLTLDELLAHVAPHGHCYGVAANCGKGFPITDDAGAEKWLDSMKGKGVLLGMQAEGREWVTMFSKETIAKFDYVFTDAMTFTDQRGKRTRLWMPAEVDVPDSRGLHGTCSWKNGRHPQPRADRHLRQSDVPARRDRQGLRQAVDAARMQRVIDAAVRTAWPSKSTTATGCPVRRSLSWPRRKGRSSASA